MGNRKLSAEERRQQIIENARKVFAQRGYFSARTRDIAESCGINEAMLYKHFVSKEEMFHEVMEQIHEEAQRIVGSHFNSDLNGMENIRAIVKGMWRDFASDPNMVANLVHSMGLSMESKKHSEMLEKRLSAHHENLARIIEMGKQDGSIRPEIDSTIFASMILSFGYIHSIMNAIGIPNIFKTPDPLPIFEEIISCMDPSIEK